MINQILRRAHMFTREIDNWLHTCRRICSSVFNWNIYFSAAVTSAKKNAPFAAECALFVLYKLPFQPLSNQERFVTFNLFFACTELLHPLPGYLLVDRKLQLCLYMYECVYFQMRMCGYNCVQGLSDERLYNWLYLVSELTIVEH